MVASPFVMVDKQAVLGALRATGSHDPDVIHARVRQLVARFRWPQVVGATLVALGVIGAIYAPPRLAGVVACVVGWWLWRRGARNVATVEAAYSEFFRAAPG